MSSELPDQLSIIDMALSNVRIAVERLSALEEGLQHLRNSAHSKGIAPAPACNLPIVEHRRLHRSGRSPIIASDPELQAFILARLDRMTYQQIADDIARHFPKERQVRRSALHAWARKRAGR